MGLTEIVPQLVEEALIASGGRYSKADDFAPYTRQDGRLITGQNPPSSAPVAQCLLDALRG